MAQSIVLTGSQCKVYLAGTLYPASSIQYTIDYGEQEIFGIDSVYPQEIATTRITVQGSISGFRVQLSGGLQGTDVRSRIGDVLHASYISLRIEDRKNLVDILLVPQIKVTSENMSIGAKGVVTVNFSFKGLLPLNILDRGSKSAASNRNKTKEARDET